MMDLPLEAARRLLNTLRPATLLDSATVCAKNPILSTRWQLCEAVAGATDGDMAARLCRCAWKEDWRTAVFEAPATRLAFSLSDKPLLCSFFTSAAHELAVYILSSLATDAQLSPNVASRYGNDELAAEKKPPPPAVRMLDALHCLSLAYALPNSEFRTSTP